MGLTAGTAEVSSSSIIKDKFSGESRGFGFVEMPNKDEADKAISGLNGKDLKGRPLTVNEARPRTDRPRTGGGGGRGRHRPHAERPRQYGRWSKACAFLAKALESNGAVQFAGTPIAGTEGRCGCLEHRPQT